MKKIKNPYDNELNMCFGCSQNNPIGLRLNFEESEEFLHATWTPSAEYQGYPNILHGGIIASLLDEIGGWCISVKIGTAGVTAEMITKYLSPVFISKGNITLKASIAEKKIKTVKCFLYDGLSKLCAEAVAEYFIYPQEIAVKKFRYPGREAFYEQE
jgi:acyl-coenzyme A thioesterase PaaI-like protein